MALHQKPPRTMSAALRNSSQKTGLDAARFAKMTPLWSRVQEFAPNKDTPPRVFRVKDPTMPSTAFGRQFLYRKEDVDNLETLSEAHKAESLLTQATDKYTDLINKEGYDIRSVSEEPVKYIAARFRWMGAVTGQPVETLIKETTRDFVWAGNAFWVKKRLDKDKDVRIGNRRLRSARDLHGRDNLGVIGAYFRADPKTMRPVYDDDTGRLKEWQQNIPGREPKTFRLEEVIHFPYKPPAGKVMGVSMFNPVIEDIRALREVEDYTIKLIIKHLFPLIHYQIPDTTEDGHGTEEDMNGAVAAYTGLAPDGMLFTPPGVVISVVETKSGSMDVTPHLKHLLQRVLMGLGLSEAIMGLSNAAAGTSDMLTAQMHDRVKSFQQDVERIFNLKVVNELLVEAGYDPINRTDDIVELEFREIELENVVRLENHWSSMYAQGVITEDETRHRFKLNPLTDKDRRLLYIYTEKIPVIEAQVKAEIAGQKDLMAHQAAQEKDVAEHGAALSKDAASHGNALAKDLATHTGKLNRDGEANKAAAAAGKPPPRPLPSPGSLRAPKLASRGAHLGLSPTKTASGGSPQGRVAAKDNPSNQHGQRGAPRFSASPAHRSKKPQSAN